MFKRRKFNGFPNKMAAKGNNFEGEHVIPVSELLQYLLTRLVVITITSIKIILFPDITEFDENDVM